MKIAILSFTTICLLCLLTPGYCKESDGERVKTFVAVTRLTKLTCSMKASTVFSSGKSYSEIDECIDKARASAKAEYKKVSPALEKNKGTSKLLRDYYVAWLSSLNGIVPKDNEIVLDYNRRQAEAEGKVDDAYNRLAIELDLD